MPLPSPFPLHSPLLQQCSQTTLLKHLLSCWLLTSSKNGGSRGHKPIQTLWPQPSPCQDWVHDGPAADKTDPTEVARLATLQIPRARAATCMSYSRDFLWAGERAPWVKIPTVNPDDPSSTSRRSELASARCPLASTRMDTHIHSVIKMKTNICKRALHDRMGCRECVWGVP